jgi:hypothetical protein
VRTRHPGCTAAASVIPCPRPTVMLLTYPTDIMAERALDQCQPPQSLLAHAVAKPTALSSR